MLVLLFCIGFIANVIGTLAGGGGLISLPTMLLIGMPVHSAIGANKVSNTLSTLSNFYSVFKRKEVTLIEVTPILLLCFIGGLIGGELASLFSGDELTFIAILFLFFAFILSFLGKTDFGENLQLTIRKKTAALLVSVGMYDGLFGPGSGTLLLYIYANEKIAYMKAVVLGRIGIFATCFGAAIMYVSSGQILWVETLSLAAGSILGSQLGILLARKISAQQAKYLLRLITAILIIQLAIDYFVK
ncbi:sulfite exporter TauE/SafE family protein [Lysinibacillus sp. 54212]|uniref:sulfite exporter TauE/SafE family protein n=1 Tax=Lysinibacillus sp. 54212 TaxID=3119829 RepID=UPI002FC60550